MAAADGSAPEHLGFFSRVAAEVKRYGLFPLLRAGEARARDLPRIGTSRLPSQNVVDLTQTPTMSFPGPTLESISVMHGRPRVDGYWLGLTGPMGPLPIHLTEFAFYERHYSRKQPFGRFLDLLAGRSLQFFYRAWASSQPAASADRPADDTFARYVSALSGAGEGREDGAFSAAARLHYAAVFAGRRSAAGIQDALTHMLGLPVRLQEFHPRWRDIPREDRTRLGGAFSGLGRDAVSGGRTRTVTDAFRIVVRARSFREFQDFLPTSRKFKIAAEALDAFAPSHLEWDIEVELAETDARPVRLDGRARLGWTSWMAPLGREGVVRADTRLGRSARRAARGDRGRV